MEEESQNDNLDHKEERKIKLKKWGKRDKGRIIDARLKVKKISNSNILRPKK